MKDRSELLLLSPPRPFASMVCCLCANRQQILELEVLAEAAASIKLALLRAGLMLNAVDVPSARAREEKWGGTYCAIWVVQEADHVLSCGSKGSKGSQAWVPLQPGSCSSQEREWTPTSWWGHQSSFDHGNLSQGCIYLLSALVHLPLPMLCTLLEAWFSPGLGRRGCGMLENKMEGGERW